MGSTVDAAAPEDSTVSDIVADKDGEKEKKVSEPSANIEEAKTASESESVPQVDGMCSDSDDDEIVRVLGGIERLPIQLLCSVSNEDVMFSDSDSESMEGLDDDEPIPQFDGTGSDDKDGEEKAAESGNKLGEEIVKKGASIEVSKDKEIVVKIVSQTTSGDNTSHVSKHSVPEDNNAATRIIPAKPGVSVTMSSVLTSLATKASLNSSSPAVESQTQATSEPDSSSKPSPAQAPASTPSTPSLSASTQSLGPSITAASKTPSPSTEASQAGERSRYESS